MKNLDRPARMNESQLDGTQACTDFIAELRQAGVRAVVMSVLVTEPDAFEVSAADWMFATPEPAYPDRRDIRDDYENGLVELVLGGLKASLESCGHQLESVAATLFVDVERGLIAVRDPVATQPLVGLEDKQGVLYMRGYES